MTKNPHAVALGKIKSPRKAESSRQNGKLGGRPKKSLSTLDVSFLHWILCHLGFHRYTQWPKYFGDTLIWERICDYCQNNPTWNR